MMVKICGITNREDLAAAAAAGAGAVGFNFYGQSPRCLAVEAAAELARETPVGVLKVGVFVNEPAGWIEQVAAKVGLDVAQLHGECGTPGSVRVWRAVPVGADFDPARLEQMDSEAVLLDAPAGSLYGGTGRAFDWDRAAGMKQRVILAGGLGPDNVGEAIRRLHPWGVDACSRLESAPGRKDASKVREFVRAAIAAEAEPGAAPWQGQTDG